MGTKIEWAQETINPIVGCSKISEACANCYAEKMAYRIANMAWARRDERLFKKYAPVTDYLRRWTGKLSFDPTELEKPTRWKKPRRIFVCSMSDIFHPGVEPIWLALILGKIRDTPRHTFMLLTKRPEIMLKHLDNTMIRQFFEQPPPNLWLGVTCENQARADERIPILLQIPSAVRFVSIEPMLGPINVTRIKAPDDDGAGASSIFPLTGKRTDMGRPCEPTGKLNWVICGGETGPGARPMHRDWARSLRDQCETAGVPFFFKSWGHWTPPGQRAFIDGWHTRPANATFQFYRFADGQDTWHEHGLKNCRLLDGQEWNQFPEVAR